MNIFNTT